MSLDAERLQVLKMVEQGQITPAEGARLLEALSRSVEEPAPAPRGDRRLRVRITDAVTGRTKVNIAIPLGLVSVGMRLGAQFAPEELGVDMVDLLRRIITNLFELADDDPWATPIPNSGFDSPLPSEQVQSEYAVRWTTIM